MITFCTFNPLLTFQNAYLACIYLMCRFQVTLARKLRFVRLLMEDLEKFRTSRLLQMRLDGAEVFIAKAYRTLVFRRKLKNLLYWNRHRCAVLIQRVYCGYRVRKKFQKIWNLHKKQVALENASALAVQQLIRSFLAKQKLKALLQKKWRAARERKARKLMLLATTNHLNLKWMLVKLYRKTKLFRIKMLRRKAILIQKVWRGKHGRQRAFIVKVMNAINRINAAFEVRVKAASKIQRTWRGFIAR